MEVFIRDLIELLSCHLPGVSEKYHAHLQADSQCPGRRGIDQSP
jgi:hypothetical protein